LLFGIALLAQRRFLLAANLICLQLFRPAL